MSSWGSRGRTTRRSSGRTTSSRRCPSRDCTSSATPAGREAHAFRRRFCGETLAVVVLDRDGPDGLLEGLSDNYLRVWFVGDPTLKGGVATVQVEAITGRGLLGSLREVLGLRPSTSLARKDATRIPVEAVGLLPPP